MIIYMVYAIILSVHRRSVTATAMEPNYNESNEVVNPDMDGGYKGDEAEL